MLPWFVKKHKIHVALFTFLFASFVMMSIDVKKRGSISLLEELIIETAASFQEGLAGIYEAVTAGWTGYVYLVNARAENELLQREVLELRERLAETREVLQENKRLKELLGFKTDSGYKTIGGRIIGFNINTLFQTASINVGSNDGVEKGMPVVSAEGVVGRVIKTSLGTSQVLLLTDKNSNIDAVLQRSRDRGVIEGTGKSLGLRYLQVNADAATGDIVVTSGMGGIFPKGIRIGKVGRIMKQPGDMFMDVTVEPFVDIGRLEDILVITGLDDLERG